MRLEFRFSACSMVTVSWENCGPSCRGGSPAFLQSWRLSQHCYMETCGRGMLQRTRKAQVGQIFINSCRTHMVCCKLRAFAHKRHQLLTIDLTEPNKKFFLSFSVIFDPASFYGHHEFDLAIAGMFGGFTSKFYDAYHHLIPKAPGFPTRHKLYVLFHYINHW